MLAILKNTVFVFWLLSSLVSLSIASTVYAFQALATTTRLSAEAAITAARHKREITAAVARVKAKARLKRMITMVPIAGVAAGAYFEEQEFEEWLIANPEGSRQEYLCEVAIMSSEVIDEVLAELPEMIRPSSTMITDMMPKCEIKESL